MTTLQHFVWNLDRNHILVSWLTDAVGGGGGGGGGRPVLIDAGPALVFVSLRVGNDPDFHGGTK